MSTVDKALLLTYTQGWMAGRSEDERIDLKDEVKMRALMQEAIASFKRWLEHTMNGGTQ